MIAKTINPTEQAIIDLGWFARTKKDHGHSYECFGNFPNRQNLKKTEKTVATFTIENYVGLPRGTVPGPTKIFLLVDGDDGANGKPGNIVGQWPEEGDNHGADGFNVAFCDGHGEFVKRFKWMDVLNTMTDGNKQPPQ